MHTSELLETLSERFATTASVKNVYGEPVTVGNRTVIPVACIRYGFGGGSGESRGEKEGHGGGGGGGVIAKPYGALEITPEGTRFLEFHPNRTLMLAVAAGFVLGTLMVRRRGLRK
jgi:uncharacterized spore protein YtfJ